LLDKEHSMGLPNISSPRPPYVPPADNSRPTLLTGDPNVILAADPASASGRAPLAQRTAVTRNLPGFGEAYLDSEFAPKVDDFVRHARDQDVDLQFESAYRSPTYREYMIAHPKETGVVYPPAEDSLHMAGLAVDMKDYAKKDAATQKIIRDSAARAGLAWGGDFPKPDVVHFYFDPAPGTPRQQLIKDFGDQMRTLFISRMKEPL
jgi:hypothetical protein